MPILKQTLLTIPNSLGVRTQRYLYATSTKAALAVAYANPGDDDDDDYWNDNSTYGEEW